ncbi:MAG: hypothetical protein OXT65_10950 [Alphaproteobacteria bacterium]|nr:hypothetical protein [Alphaproteobacteria bacterium]
MSDKDTDKTDKKPTNGERDSLDSLSLSMIPLGSNTLKNAKLIKNSRLETAVELYNDPIAGSLQIYPEDIADQIAASERDQEIINQLAGLHSYDVYSLRSSLKKLGIETEETASLELSKDMKEALSDMTVQFTRPLIERIFGDGAINASDAQALQKIFRDPDVKRVRDNLRQMQEATGIPLEEIPKFLEEYSDIFLSVAYYKYSFDNVGRDIDRFMKWVKELRNHRDVSSTPQTAAHCKNVEDHLSFIIDSIRERLVKFQVSFEVFWQNISRESFEELRAQIEENHSSMGSVLCGLSVKMNGWAEAFPDNNVGGPQKRAKYVVTEIEPGLERLRKEEATARSNLGMPPLK